MDWSQKGLLKLIIMVLIVFEAIHGSYGAAMVSGSVFCDQCKDGEVSLLDYPLNGIKVAMSCPGSDGQLTVSAEETTDWLGHFSMNFDGVPDLRGCFATVSGQGSSDCGAVAGPAKAVRLMFRMFETAMYIVDPLVSQPARPVSYCPSSSTPPVSPSPPVTTLPPPTPALPLPVTVLPQPTPELPPPELTPPVTTIAPPTPRWGMPRLMAPLAPPLSTPIVIAPPTPALGTPTIIAPPTPALGTPTIIAPPIPPPALPPPVTILPPPSPSPPMPPGPIMEASACPHERWTKPEYRCYWRVLTPDTKVAVVFGLIAARRYGTDISVFEAMQGRGDPYKTLLREATTALLNSYNSLQFPYHPLSVLEDMNYALMGSTSEVLHTGLGFVRANSGDGKIPCKLTACK